ncbi:MAG TPA: hypothetical protein VGB94_13990 [Acidobacteriaceae bacterium]
MAAPSASSVTLEAVSGKAIGGETPIGNGAVTLYATAANTSVSGGSYVGTATVLGTTTTAVGTGMFSFNPSSYVCPANAQVYVTISGGDTGGGANGNELLGAMLGPCGSLTPFVVVNEVTTVAMAYSMSSFTSLSGSTVNITAPSANSSVAATNSVTANTVSAASGLAHAYANYTNLVNSAQGFAYAVPPSNSGAIAPQTVINTIANAMQSCVNSTGGIASDTSTNCGKFFSYTPSVSGSSPSNTFQAALNIARNPYVSSTNVSNLYGMGGGVGAAFSPALSAAPNDWTLAIQYPVPANPLSGTKAFPFTLALDADDNVFVTSPENDPWAPTATAKSTTNSISACLYGWASNGTFRPTITPYTGTGGTPGAAGSGTAGSSNWFCTSSAAATAQNDYLLTNIAIDNTGAVWMHNYGAGATGSAGTRPSTALDFVVNASNTGSFIANYIPPVQAAATQDFQNIGLAIDKYNNVFFNALTATSAVPNIIAFSAGAGGTISTGTALTIGSTTTAPTFASSGRGLAFDSLGDFFGASFGGSSGTLGSLSLGGTAFFMPITGTQAAGSAPYNCITATNTACSIADVYKTIVGGASSSGGTTNNAPYGVAIDSSNNSWLTAGGTPGQTEGAGIVNGIFECTSVNYATTKATCNTITSAVTAPKFLEVDGNNTVWVADTTGILAWSTTAPTPAFISPSGGFKPCIVQTSTTTCTYPDFNVSIKGIAVDSTGSVWFTTPDLTTTSTNANSLIQIIGSATAAWPLLATQKPGTMPQ